MTGCEIRSQTAEIGKARWLAMTNKKILLALCSLLFAPCSAGAATDEVRAGDPFKTARQIGLTIRPNVLTKVDEVIQ
jgi:hypothetical protein